MRSSFVGAAAAALVVASSSFGVVITPGLYRLHNHPDGNLRPPYYGLRLDELYDITPGGNNDDYTFDFDFAGDSSFPASAMYMDYNGYTIHIYGTTYGGRDIGGSYANDIYRGMYTVNFTYALGVQMVPGDDDLMVEPPSYALNTGTIITPLGHTIALRDGHYDDPTQLDFRLGDESNDLGHRGYAGISGWGWLFHGPEGSPYHADSDWLFTATLVPAPGALALMGIGALTLRRRHR